MGGYVRLSTAILIESPEPADGQLGRIVSRWLVGTNSKGKPEVGVILPLAISFVSVYDRMD